MSSLGANRNYLRQLAAQLREVPRVAAAEVAIRLFTGVLHYTAQDSGQAALNWRMQPYKGSPSFAQAQMYWGFGDVTPVAPAGYKWSGGATAEAVLLAQYQYGMVAKASLEGQDFDGVVIYNPIEPETVFAPEANYERYYTHAFSDVQANLAKIISDAFVEGFRATAARFHFVRYA